MAGFGEDNLPYGVFERAGEAPRVGARLQDDVLDLRALAIDEAFAAPSLDAFLDRGPAAWRTARERLHALVAAGGAERARIPLADVTLRLPFTVADFADFYSGEHHAAKVGQLFRPEVADPLPANWKHLPVGYHSRAGTVVVSPTPVERPLGQTPAFGPTRRLDFELELGFVIGTPGRRVPVSRALDHVFGVTLLNDWSARDIQRWESVPLGPFGAKAFATSISAWITPLEALAAARVPRPAQEPEPAPYLREPPWAFDLDLAVELNGTTIAATSARHLYWSAAQQIAHLTITGATLRRGDLLGSGTISGPGPDERGCLLEATADGAEPLALAGGERRTYLEDGDEVVLRGAHGDLALGEVRGRVQPSGSA